MTKFQDIFVDFDERLGDRGLWAVFFEDENGMSILAKCLTEEEAEARAEYHRGVLASGKLLKEDESVWTL